MGLSDLGVEMSPRARHVPRTHAGLARAVPEPCCSSLQLEPARPCRARHVPGTTTVRWHLNGGAFCIFFCRKPPNSYKLPLEGFLKKKFKMKPLRSKWALEEEGG